MIMRSLLATCIVTLLVIERALSFHVSFTLNKHSYRNVNVDNTYKRIDLSEHQSSSGLYLSSIPNEDDMIRKYDDNDDDNDDDEDDDEEFEDIATSLGINIGKELGLTPSQQKEIIKKGTELMEKAYEKEINDIEKQRARMKRDIEREAGVRNMASELRAKYEAEKLLERIDKKKDDFLSSNKDIRESTKMAAMADRNMQGKGIELGSWGKDANGNVIATGYKPPQQEKKSSSSFVTSEGSLLEEEEWGEVISVKMENKVLLFNDNDNKESQSVLKEICNKLEDLDIKTELISPIKPAPLGGSDSQTVVFFASSFSEKSAVMTMLERLLSRTASGNGRVSIPPSHIICISSLGTVKASSNGLLGFMMTGLNGKLDKYREIEEGIVSKCRTRFGNQAFDYSILKFGNIVPTNKVKGPANISEGDAGSGETDAQTAADVLVQTIAYQYHSRNTTLSAIGTSNFASASTTQQQWDDLFLSLDGPELLRTYIPFETQQLQEKCQFYVQNWAVTKFVDAKSTGLSTPAIVENTPNGVKIIFKPTNTGKAYKSKDEERKLEQQSTKYKSPTSKQPSSINTKELTEGGIEIVFEKDYEGGFRLRAKRCNMSYDTVVKEMSEETILSKLKTVVDYFINNNEE